MIRLEGVSKSFGELTVLRKLDLEVAEGETFVMLGRSGAGKSVLLKHIVGLLAPDEGRIYVDDDEVTGASVATLRRIRSDVAYLFQTGALVNWMTVRENVSLPLVERRSESHAAIAKRVDAVLESVGMGAASEKFPTEISGGMRKRAALARVLVQEPRAILYDEPAAGLDPILTRTVGELIKDVQRTAQRTALVVTHNLGLAFEIADRIGLHHEGRLIEVGTPEDFRRSEHPAVQTFLNPAGKTQQS